MRAKVMVELEELSEKELEMLFNLVSGSESIGKQNVDFIIKFGYEIKNRLADGRIVHNAKGIPSAWDIFVGEVGLQEG